MIGAYSLSPTGRYFIGSSTSAQPRVYDRDGEVVVKFWKGDTYINDMSNTEGHVALVTGASWHPVDEKV